MEVNSDSPVENDGNKEEYKSRKIKQYLAAFSVSFGTLCVGTVMGWTSPVLEQVTPNKHVTTNFSLSNRKLLLTDNELALLGGTFSFGALISSIPAGYCAHKFGRKKVIISTSFIFFLSYLIIIFANAPITLIIGRIFGGIASGSMNVLSPMYIGEIAEPSIRGALVSLNDLACLIGILLSWVIGTFTNWMILSIILCVITIIFAIISVFILESPYHLISVDRINDATNILKQLREEKYNVTEEIQNLQNEINKSKERAITLCNFFESKANRRALFLSVSVIILQELTGTDAIITYAASIFRRSDSFLSPNTVVIILGIVQALTCYITIFIVDRIGRKILLIISSVGLAIVLIIIGTYFYLEESKDLADNVSFIPLFFTILYMIFFGCGYGPIPWVLLSELFAPEIKGTANGFALSISFSFTFIVTFCFPLISDSYGIYVNFYIFGCMMTIAVGFVYYFVPETKKKSFFEIQEILNK